MPKYTCFWRFFPNYGLAFPSYCYSDSEYNFSNRICNNIPTQFSFRLARSLQYLANDILNEVDIEFYLATLIQICCYLIRIVEIIMISGKIQ